MTNFMETRGMLAKLLATENLIVQHSAEAQTAAFNTEERVLTLPILNTENENVYNLFVAHECSHALYTPSNWVDEVPNGVPFDFVNVIEDVRIEKLIQDKFPGLRRDFTKGYDELNDKDFFGIADRDLSKLSLIDRINLRFKLGVRALVPFNDEEMTYVQAVDEADTFSKVCLVSKMLCDYLKAKKEEEQKDTEQPTSTSGSGQEQGDSQSGNDGESEETDQPTQNENQSSGMNTDEGDQPGADGTADEMSSKTQNQFDDQLERLTKTGMNTRKNIIYITPGEVNLKEQVVPVSVLRQSFSESEIDSVDLEFNKFLTSIKRDVNFMVQQFEMKKSADAYARQQVHKTGVLNTGVLHNYKLTDDLFLRQTVTPDGKNHGMIMLIDWSGSMANTIVSVVKQLITLVQFCRKVQIPFEVYTFTSGGGRDHERHPHRSISFSDIQVVQVITSTSKAREIDTDLRNLYSQAIAVSTYRHVAHSIQLCMGGTPLNNTLFLVPKLVERFRAQTKAQKVSLCVLTDGESGPLYYWEDRKITSYGGAFEIISRPSYAYYEELMLRDGFNVINLGGYCDNTTGKIAAYLHNTIKDLNIFNIFIGQPKSCGRYVKNNTIGQDDVFDEKVFRRENAFVVHTEGWPMICVISPKAFGEAEEEIQVEAGESKAKIKSALKKFLASKQTSKNLLSRIVSSFA
jgi:hypothetical protein